MRCCENCSSLIEGTYGSGRFCSATCAKGFSTKSKREAINAKVSEKLSGRGNEKITSKCGECGNMFTVAFAKRKQQTCSRKCAKSMVSKSQAYRSKLSTKRIAAIEAGVTNGSGIKCTFEFRGNPIKCDSKLEFACLVFFMETYVVRSISRCIEKIEYEVDGKFHKYIPDFLIETDDGMFIVECKSTKLGNDLRAKWQTYIKLTEIKKQLLSEFAENHGMKDFWFTEKTFNGYKKLKI